MNYLKITGSIPKSGQVTFIMKVMFPHYAPQGVEVISAISDIAFNCQCNLSELDRISNDKNILSIEIIV